MKLTIDTKEDSTEEIKKAIAMLQALVKGKGTGSGDFDTSEGSGGAFASMFGGSSETRKEETEEGKKEETPRVIEY